MNNGKLEVENSGGGNVPEDSESFAAFENELRMVEVLVGSAALAKACFDEFDYAMKLSTGEVIDFSSAKVLNKEWVHLVIKPMKDQPKVNRIVYPAERGMDVRLADIVWVMDAPQGS